MLVVAGRLDPAPGGPATHDLNTTAPLALRADGPLGPQQLRHAVRRRQPGRLRGEARRQHGRPAGAVPAQPRLRAGAGEAPGRARDPRRADGRSRPRSAACSGCCSRDRRPRTRSKIARQLLAKPRTGGPKPRGGTWPTCCCAATSSCTSTDIGARIHATATLSLPPRDAGHRRHRLRPAGARRPARGRGEEAAEPDRAANPYAVRRPHHAPRAKRVIFLFMPGGPSHVDLFDPKPRLAADNGKPLPFEKPKLERTKTGNLLASPWKFAKHGQSRHRGQRAVPARRRRASTTSASIRSMVADNINHTGACLQMNTGEQAFSRPSLGSWLALRPGHREPEPARLRRHQPRRPVPGRAALERRASCPPRTRARSSAT